MKYETSVPPLFLFPPTTADSLYLALLRNNIALMSDTGGGTKKYLSSWCLPSSYPCDMDA